MGDVVAMFQQWFKRPFDPEGDAVNWVIFLAFVVTVAFAWTRVLRHISE